MAVTTKKTFNAVGTGGQGTTTFTPVSIELNNQDDLDVYVTLSGGTRVLQYRQSSGSTTDSNHPQVNDTTGLYFPPQSTGVTLYNYTLSTDNNTITFNSALPTGAVVSVERRTRDGSSDYTNFAGGSTIRHTDLNTAFDESNFTAQEARNKAFDIERQVLGGADGNLTVPEDKTIIFEGATDNTYETTLTVTDPTADRTITLPDASGTVLLSGGALNVESSDIVNGTIQEVDLSNNAVTTAKIAADAIDGTRLADNAVDSEHYTDASIDHVHLSNDCIDGDNIQDDVVNSEHIAAGALDNEHYAAGSVTADKLNAATIVTNSEQGSATANDTSFFTTSASDARYFNVSTGDTIKDGDTFPDNDTTIATTAAINDRIVDLVDDVGGFVPIANETSFPAANPDVNNGAGTLVSIKALASNLTSNGSGVATIANGAGSGNTVTINGLANSTTYAATFGMIVETTSTLHTYTFHRQVPKATEVTTVAGSVTNVNNVGNNISNVNTVAGISSDVTAVAGDATDIGTVAGISSNVTTVAGISSNVTTVAGIASDVTAVAGKATEVGRLGTADAVSDLNTLGTNAIVSDLDTCATNISNINTVGGSISNVNTVASNMSTVNDFAARYRVAASAPSSSLDAGDLYFDTSGNELKVYNGSAWQGGVTATGNLISKSGDTFTGDVILDNGRAIKFSELDSNGAHTVSIKAPDSVTADVTLTLPDGDGSADQYLKTNGSGVLSWSTVNTTIADDSLGEVKLDIHNAPSGTDKFLAYTANGMEWVVPTDTNTNVLSGGTIDGDVTLTGAANNVVWDKSDNALEFADNAKAVFGTGADFQIVHTGSACTLTNSTGATTLGSAGVFTITNESADSTRLTATHAGSVDLYYSGSKKLHTRSDGIEVTGVVSASDHIYLPDDKKLRLGNNPDLEIYHDGSNSYIDNATGQLTIRADQVRFLNAAGSENFIDGNADGSVDLYYNGNKQLSTSADGLIVGDSDHAYSLIRIDHEDNTGTGELQLNAYGTASLKILSNFSGSADSGVPNDAFGISTPHTKDIHICTAGTSRMTIASGGAVTCTGTVSDSKGNLRSVPYVAKTSSYTLVAADAGQAISSSSGGWTIPNDVMSAGDVVTLINVSSGDLTITKGSGLNMYFANDASNTDRTLATRGVATIYFLSGGGASITGAGLS